MLIIQCLSPKSSPMAKSRKNPGCLRPIIAIVQYRDGVPPPGIFWRGFAGGRLEGCGAVLLDRYICVTGTDAQVLEIWANAIAHIQHGGGWSRGVWERLSTAALMELPRDAQLPCDEFKFCFNVRFDDFDNDYPMCVTTETNACNAMDWVQFMAIIVVE